MKPATLNFRSDLQGLRAIAILLVVFSHAGITTFAGGFIGVDVFFVLSGYLITGLLIHEFRASSTINFPTFYARRLKRLLPALAFMLVTIFAAAILILSTSEARAQLASSSYAVTWLSNFYFAFTSIDYFDELSVKDLFLHTWSLGVEEQFYLIWPAILACLFKIGVGKHSSKEMPYKALFWGLFFLMLSSFALSQAWVMDEQQLAFYMMPARIWQFSVGALITIYTQTSVSSVDNSSGVTKPAFYLTLYVGLLLILGSSLAFSPKMSYPGYWAILPTLGTALILLSGHLSPKQAKNPLQHPALIWIGDRSYSLYLWHWPIFIFGLSLGLQSSLHMLAMCSLLLLTTVFSYNYIELPFWKGRWSSVNAKKGILFSLLTVVCLVFVISYVQRNLLVESDTKDISYQWRADVPHIYKIPCDTWYSSAEVAPCVFGRAASKKTVVLLGDSVGAQWFSMVPAIFRAPEWRTIVLTKSSCPMVDEDYFYPRIGKVYQVCNHWRSAVLEKLEEIRPDVIIMGSAATYDYTEEQWLEGTTRVLNRLGKAAKTTLIIPGTPSLGFDGPSCISRHHSKGSLNQTACQATGRLTQVNKVTRILTQATNRHVNINILPLNDLVCPEENCNAINAQGVVVFRDSQHLTDSFVRSQSAIISRRISKLMSMHKQ